MVGLGVNAAWEEKGPLGLNLMEMFQNWKGLTWMEFGKSSDHKEGSDQNLKPCGVLGALSLMVHGFDEV